MEIEELSPKSTRQPLAHGHRPGGGLAEYQARELAFRLGLAVGQVGAGRRKSSCACYRAYRDLDATMVEINPLIVTAKGELMALDAKMSFDTTRSSATPEVLRCAT
jgi:malate-CoA ligase subunit beta